MEDRTQCGRNGHLRYPGRPRYVAHRASYTSKCGTLRYPVGPGFLQAQGQGAVQFTGPTASLLVLAKSAFSYMLIS